MARPRHRLKLNLSDHAAYAACRVLPPALLHRLIVLARARTHVRWLRVPIALEKEAEPVVAPVVAARNGDTNRRPAHQEAVVAPVVAARNGDTNRRTAQQGAALGLVGER